MQLTTSQLQTHHKSLVEALKRGEKVEITYHGQLLGVVYPKQLAVDSQAQEEAMAAFFGIHKNQSAVNVEDELRAVRKGRRSRF